MSEEVNFQDWFKNIKTINELPPIPKDLNTKHLQEFINELKDSDINE